jgi:hypothetical protein
MSTIETRLSELEARVTVLTQQLSLSTQNGNWVDAVAGSFRNDPEFDEVLRLGELFRRQDESECTQDNTEV